MMFRKFDYSKKWTKVGLWGLALLACIGMAENKLNRQQCNNLIVNIDYDSGVRFINAVDVEKILAGSSWGPVQGSKQKNISLAALEKGISKNRLVKSCQVYHDLEGNLVVDVKQQQPLARWIGLSQRDEWRRAGGGYVSDEGAFLPLSDRFSARVLLISGAFFQNRENLDSADGRAVLQLLHLLDADPFWKAQVVELSVASNGQIEMRTALGDQRIKLGLAENVPEKLRKLRIFYDKVLSADWSRYVSIDLRFRDQIVCE